jgi:amino acid permease
MPVEAHSLSTMSSHRRKMPPCWPKWGKSTLPTQSLSLTSGSYKQELKRNFTMIEVFGIAFSIMGLLPSIASTLAYSLPAGPVGLVWGWFLASMFIFIVGLAMADLGSAMPTSGG